jgi:hypothetical protein
MLEHDVSSYRTHRPTAYPLERFSVFQRQERNISYIYHKTSTVKLAAQFTNLYRLNNGKTVSNSARSADLSAFFCVRTDPAEGSLCHTLFPNSNISKGNPRPTGIL